MTSRKNYHVSIIIPAYNEEKLIAGTLASINLASQNQPDTITMVVDNQSADETAQIAQEFGALVIRESKKGVGQARQTGLEAAPASARYILTTDADTFVPLEWIHLHLNSLNQESVVCTHGDIKYFLENDIGLSDKLIYFLFKNTTDIIRYLKKKPQPIRIGGSNTGFKKDMALQCGGYNRDLTHGEDMDIIKKLSQLGRVVQIDNEVVTSSRRIFGEGILPKFISSVRHNLPAFLGGLESKEKQFINEFIDYR